jgi:hypothetical protein
VEGVAGSILQLAGRKQDAESWFARVVARKDESVRPEIMRIALRAYTLLLWGRGEMLESVKVRYRAVTFERAHSEAAPPKSEGAASR